MEEKINIVAILKDKPKETKLYSSACGKCELKQVDDNSFKISFYNSKFGFMNGGEGTFGKNGNLYDDGECVVFPSKEMRDWSKFAWKKGDVLVSNDGGTEVIFDKWYDDTYTSFYGKHYLNSENENNIVYKEAFVCTTERYSLEEKDSVQTYINTIEERLGGKFNRETLEVEKAQPEFKDGDIIYCESGGYHYPTIHILNSNCDTRRYYARLVINGRYDESIDYDIPAFDDGNPNKHRYATEEEKRQLFDALAKEGKAWDADKKQVVDFKPKWTPKPFDKVLVRDSKSDKWRANLFGYIDKDEYYHCVYVNWVYCIPYEGNEHLLGTTKDVEG